MNLIMGLGNPGKAYVGNRHNVGFRCIDFLARGHGISLRQRKARSQLGVGMVLGTKVALAKPQTFMNLSGEAAAALKRRYRLRDECLLVVHDDLDLPLGRIRIRERGGAGGHRGVESVIDRLGSQDFPRLRVGIASLGGEDGSPRGEVDAIDHVLSDFTAEEMVTIRKVYADVGAAIECLLTGGIVAAMNKYN